MWSEAQSTRRTPICGARKRDDVSRSIDDSTTIERERSAIATAGRLHWLHWLVVGLSVCVTLTAWQITSSQAEDKIQNRFDRDAEQAVSLVAERMQRYEDGLWGGVSAVRSQGDDVTLESWRVFAESLNIEEKYPGINGIGVIHRVEPNQLDGYLLEQRKSRPDYGIHPAHDEATYFPITYIEPVAPNAAAVGLDMAHEANRQAGVQRSRDTGQAQITGPIVLVQDEERTPGFLFFAPWYEDGQSATPEDREENFRGVVYAPFVMQKLLDGALAKEIREIGIRINDGAEVLYDEHTPEVPDFDPDPLFTRTITVDMYGRTWDFDIWTALSFRAAATNHEPTIILIGGLTLDLLLLSMFLMLSRSNRRALRFADRASEDLQLESDRLAESNQELETFAYVASHDLKTPLRGIDHLTEYLEDDLDAYLASADVNPDVKRNLTRIREQIARMESLISGILEYSRLANLDDEPPMVVSVETLVERLSQDLMAGERDVIHAGPNEVRVPAPVYFEQVIQNLVANAVAHHDDPADANIAVAVREQDDHLVISVIDDGPGIAEEFHERIFDVFQTLGTAGSGTGIGLAIVKKLVTSRGGAVRLTSTPGEGSTFEFDWPGVDVVPTSTTGLQQHQEARSSTWSNV